MADDELHLIGPDEIAYRLDLTPAQLKITHTALRSFLDDFVPAVELVGQLDHIGKWPAEHWHLAFQGQLRAVSESDARLLTDRIRQAAAAYSAA